MDVATGMNFEAGVDDPKVIEAEVKLLKRMGFNNVWEPIAPAQELEKFNAKMGLAPRYGLTLHAFHNQGSGDHCTNVPLLPLEKVEARAKELAEKYAPVMDKVVRIVIADEPAGMSVEHILRHDVDRKLFTEQLKEQGYTPKDLGVASWAEVVPVAEADHLKYPELWYHTVMFNLRSTNNLTKQCVAIVRKYFPAHVKTFVNYVPPLGYGDWIPTGADPFMMQRSGGLDLGWTEDWRAYGVSPQHISETLAMLRAAGQFKQPLGAYMVGVDSPPNVLRQKYYGLLAGGARQFNVYNYGPAYASVDVWGGQHEIFPVITAVNHEIGVIDEALQNTTRAKTDIAILYNRTASVWAAAERKLTTQLDGRFARWALSHAGYDADFIPEEDIEVGNLSRYKVLYMTGLQIRPETARKIADWVKSGGTVFATAGAGTRDHYNRPLNALNEVFGMQSQNLKVEQEIGLTPKSEIAVLPAMETLTSTGGGTPKVSFNRLSMRESLTPAANAKVILKNTAGQPAGLLHSFGKGRAIRIAALPGIAYVSDALRKDFNLNTDYLPKNFRQELRNFLIWPAQLAKATRIAQSNAGATEITRYNGQNRAVIFVIDHAGQSHPNFTMKLNAAQGFTKAYSASGKPVRVKAGQGGVLEVSFPLNATDAVVLEK